MESQHQPPNAWIPLRLIPIYDPAVGAKDLSPCGASWESTVLVELPKGKKFLAVAKKNYNFNSYIP